MFYDNRINTLGHSSENNQRFFETKISKFHPDTPRWSTEHLLLKKKNMSLVVSGITSNNSADRFSLVNSLITFNMKNNVANLSMFLGKT